MKIALQGSFILIITLSVLLAACSGKKEEQQEVAQTTTPSIIGKWNATWEMSGKDVEDTEPRFRKMNGKINFIDSSSVEITTYGFDGCVFMTDTSVNTLNWRMEDKILRFVDKDDALGIPYVVEEFSDEKIELSIMGDIHLNLDR